MILRAALLALGLALATGATSSAEPGATVTAETDYGYRMQPRDTLIGVSQRLLVEPRRWPELQSLNGIARANRIPTGTVLRIPRDWLRQSAEQLRVGSVSGGSDGTAALAAGAALAEGARIETAIGGRATLELADGSVVILGEGTRVGVERLRRYESLPARETRFLLERGEVEIRATTQDPNSRFQIRSPVAISAVRGTEFRRGFDAGVALDRTEVVGGAVDVAGSAATVAVAAGFGTLADASGVPREPVRLLPPPDLSGLPRQLDAEALDVSFPPVAGAVAYRVEVATDAEFREVRSGQTVMQPAANFGSLADGRYWLRARSIDPDGLNGADVQHEFTRRLRLAGPTAVAPAAGAVETGQRIVLRWAPVGGAARYRLEVSAASSSGGTILAREDLTATEFTLQSLPPGDYRWRVAGIDAAGASGAWSDSAGFSSKPDLTPWWHDVAPLLILLPLLL